MATTIDNKTVQMNFDNANFERNISQSMNSLKQMDGQLQSMEQSKSLETLNKQAKQMDFSHMSKGIENVRVRFSALQVAGATVISELTKKAMAFGSSLVKNTFGQIKSGGIKRALNLEQAEFQVTGLAKNVMKTDKRFKEKADVWKALLKDVDYAVDGTAYGLDEASKVASQLMASNVKIGNDMKTSLRGISGMAAMTGRTYSDIGNIFTKVAGNGRLMSQELLQFSASGLNAAATLTDYLNKHKSVRESIIKTGLQSKKGAKDVKQFAKSTKLTEQNLRTLVTAGAIDFKTFSKAMDEAFGEHATKANDTYEGSLMNVKAALSRVGEPIATNTFENLRKIFNTLIPIINGVKKELIPLMDYIQELEDIVGKFVRNTLKGLELSYEKVKVNGKTKEVVSGVKTIHEAVKSFTEYFKKTVNIVTESVKSFEPAIDSVKNIFIQLQDILTKVFSGTVEDKLNTLGKGITYLGNVVSKLFGILELVVKILTPIIIPAIKVIVGLLYGAASAFKILVDNIHQFLSTNEAFLTGIAEKIVTVFNTLKPLFMSLWNLGTAVFDAIGKALSTLFESFKNSKSKGFDTFVDGLKGIVNVISSVINKIAELIRKTQVVQSIGLLLGTIIKGIGYVLTHLGTVIGKLLKGVSNLFNKIKEGIRLGDTLKNIMDTVKNGISDIIGMLNQNGDTVIRTSVFALLAVKIKQLIWAFRDLQGKGLLKYARPVQNILTNLGTTIFKFNQQIRYQTLKQIAISILLLSVSLMLLAGIPKDKLNTAITAITALFFDLTKSFASMSKVGSFKMGPVVRTLLSISVSVLILSSALKKLSDIKEKDLKKSLVAITVLILEMVGVLKLLNTGNKGMATGVFTILALAEAIKMLVKPVKDLAKMSWDSLLRGLAGIGILLAGIAGFLTLTSLVDNKIGKTSIRSAINILAVSKAIAILSTAVIAFGAMSWAEIGKGLAAVGSLLAGIVGYITLTALIGDKIGKSSVKSALAVIIIAKSIEMLAGVVKEMSKLSWADFGKGMAVVGSLMGSLVVFIAALNVVGKTSLKSAAGLLMTAMALRVIAGVVSMFANMQIENLVNGLLAFISVLMSLAIALNAMKGTIGGSIALTNAAVGIMLLAAALKLISTIPIPGLVASIVAMAACLTILGVAVYFLGGSIPMIFALGVAMGVFGAGVALLGIGVLACVAALDLFVKLIVHIGVGLKDILLALVEAVVESIKGLVIGIADMAPELVRAITELLKGALQIIRDIVPDLAVTIFEVLNSVLATIASNIGPIVQSLIDIIIGIINGVASRVGDLTDAIGNLLGAIGDQIVKAIGNISMDSILKLLLSITAISLIIKMLSSMQTQAAKAIITVALIAVSLLILTGVFALIGMIDNSLTDKLNAITVFLAVMTLVLIGCAIIGNFAAQALIGLGVLIIAIAAITGVMIVLGALADLVEPFINKGGPLLVKIGSFIGQFIGAFVAGIATQAVQAIPALGEALGAFGVAIGPFIDALNKMSLDALAKIAILVAIVMAITATSFLSGITKFLSFGNDPIDEFIITIVKLAEGFKKFNSVISGVDASGAETAANVIAKLAIAANLIPSSGGWLQNLVGNKDLDGFGKAIISLANGLKTFANSVDTSIDVEALTPYVNLIKKIAEIANLIPRSGGWLQNIAGNKDLAGFGNAITPLADGIKGFADKAAEIKDPSALENIINIVKKMVEVQNDLPRSGGLWQAIAGEQDWSQLSEGLNSMVDCFKSISKTLNSKSVNLDVITTAVNLLKDIAKVNNDAIKIGDKADKKEDEGDSQTFVAKIVEPVKKAVNKIKEYQKTLKQSDMESMTGYFKVLKNFINTLGKEFSDKETQKNLKLVETVGNTIASLLTSVLKIRTLMSNNSKKGKGEDSLTSQLTAFGDTIVAFSTTMAKIDLTGITQGKNAVDTLKSMSDLKIDKFSTAKTSVENLKTALKAFKDLNKEKLSTGKDGQGGQLKTLKTYVKNIKTAIKDMASDLGKNSDVDKALKNVKGFGSKVKTFSGGLKSLASAFKEINGTTINSKKGQDIADAMTNVSKGGINKFVKGLEGNKGKIKSAYNTFLGKVKSVAKKDNATYEAFRQAGKNTINGYVKGLDDLKGSVSSKYKSIMNANIRVVAKVNKSKSPSKVYENLGLYTMQGYEKGVTKGAVAVKSTLSGTLTTINNKLESGLETGIKKGKALKFAKSYYKNLWKNIKSVSGIGNFRDLFNQGASKNAIKKYFDDAAIELYAENNNKRAKKIKKNLQKYYKTISKYEKKYGKDAEKDLEKRVNKAEEKYNKKHTKARKDRLKRAKKDLNAYTKARDKRKELTDAIKSDWEELSNTIKDNAHSFLDPLSNAIDTGIDLFNKFERGQRISSSRMLANMRSQIKAASDYNSDVDKLRNKGLSESLIKQLKEQGISGWENVKAFLRMTPEQIAEANSLDQAKTKMSFETMMTGLVDRINQAKSWKQKIAELTRRGLDKNALKEILNMGIEEAGPYIDALLSADNAQLASFNKKFNAARSLEKDLAKSGLSSYAKSVNEGATNKINKKSGKKASDQYINGIIKGLTDKNNKKKIKHAAGGLAQTIINEVNRRLKIKSPSREGERSGMYTVLGLVQGIAQNLNLAQNAGEELADAIITPLDQLEDTQNSVGENPTITPILDLDRLERDLQELDNMFKNDYAIGIAASMSRDGNIGGAQNTKNGDIINNYNNEFTQNNYSPEPLDRVGIYRDTKGWINSKMKGGVATT